MKSLRELLIRRGGEDKLAALSSMRPERDWSIMIVFFGALLFVVAGVSVYATRTLSASVVMIPDELVGPVEVPRIQHHLLVKTKERLANMPARSSSATSTGTTTIDLR